MRCYQPVARSICYPRSFYRVVLSIVSSRGFSIRLGCTPKLNRGLQHRLVAIDTSTYVSIEGEGERCTTIYHLGLFYSYSSKELCSIFRINLLRLFLLRFNVLPDDFLRRGTLAMTPHVFTGFVGWLDLRLHFRLFHRPRSLRSNEPRDLINVYMAVQWPTGG